MDTSTIFKQLGFDGNIRITPDGKASVLDIISVAGGHDNTRVVWKRLSDDQELVKFCNIFKFKGQGARDTPVISAEGLDTLINSIPGETAKKFRIKGCETLRRIMAGDRTLIDEIERNHYIAQTDNGSAQAFFNKTLTKTQARDFNSFDKTNYIYVRGLEETLISNIDTRSNTESNEKRPQMSMELVKFGIAQSLDKRNDGYKDDDGFYFYALCLNRYSQAAHVEAIVRSKFRHITLDGKHEYVNACKLYNYFNPGYEIDEDQLLTPFQYKDLLRSLYTYIVSETHRMYPQTLETSEPYGRTYYSRIKYVDNSDNVAEQHDDCEKGDKHSEVVHSVLEADDLPEYGQLFPDHKVQLLNGQALIEREKTKQAIEDRLKAHENRLKTEATEERLKVEAQEKSKQEQERTKQMALQIELIKLQQQSTSAPQPLRAPPIAPPRHVIQRQVVADTATDAAKILHQHVRDFIAMNCIIEAGEKEHTMNIRNSFEQFRRRDNRSGGWPELMTYMMSLGCVHLTSSFLDRRRPQKKKTKGWMGIILKDSAFQRLSQGGW